MPERLLNFFKHIDVETNATTFSVFAEGIQTKMQIPTLSTFFGSSLEIRIISHFLDCADPSQIC